MGEMKAVSRQVHRCLVIKFCSLFMSLALRGVGPLFGRSFEKSNDDDLILPVHLRGQTLGATGGAAIPTPGETSTLEASDCLTKKPLVSQLADLHSWRSRRERWHQISPNHLCVWFLDSTQNESWAGTLHIITFLFPQDQRMACQSTSARMVFDWSDHNGLFPSVCVQPLCEPTALFGVDPCIQRRQTFHTFRSDWDSGMVWYLTWNRLVASLEPHSWPVPMSAKVGTKMFLGSVSHGTHHHFLLTSLRAKSRSLGLTGVVIVLSRL